MDPQTKLPLDVTEGAAFPVFVKCLASGLMLALAVMGAQAGPQMAEVSWTATSLALLLGALVLIALVYYWMLHSRTRIDATHIRQTWLWRKEVALADVAHVKLVFIPWLDWLIAPRLVVRARGSGVIVFHAADRQVLQAFARAFHPAGAARAAG